MTHASVTDTTLAMPPPGECDKIVARAAADAQ